MQIYQHKHIDYCFVVVCIDSSTGLFKNTIDSIQQQHPGVPAICVVSKGTDPETTKFMESRCEVSHGGSTVTSLINEGFRKAQREWAFVVFSGSLARLKMHEKISFYIQSKKDILFPVANNIANFVDGTMNGMLVHRDTFRLVGDMPEDSDLGLSKAIWAHEAVNHGCRLKAIVGAKIC